MSEKTKVHIKGFEPDTLKNIDCYGYIDGYVSNNNIGFVCVIYNNKIGFFRTFDLIVVDEDEYRENTKVQENIINN